MATDKNSGAGESTSPLADRLLARSGRARGIGAGSSLFRRLGLENPYEGGAIEDASVGGKGMFSFLSSKAYFDELRGLSSVRRHLMWRIESIRHRISAGDRYDRLNRSVATSAVRAAMLGFDRNQPNSGMTLVDWSTQVDPAVEAPAPMAAQPSSEGRAVGRSTRATAAERALRNQIAQAGEVLAELQEVVRGLPQSERSSMEGRVRELRGLSERGQMAGARQAVRRLRGVSAVAVRGSRIAASSSAVGERPLAVAQGRLADPTSEARPTKGLRRVLATSPIAMTLEQPEAAPMAPVTVGSPEVRPTIERAHAHRGVPVASVARDVRNQSATGRAGPPRVQGALAHPTPASVSALHAPRPTERIARMAVQTQTAPLNDLRRGLAAAGVLRSGPVPSRIEARVAARAEVGIPDAQGSVLAGFAHARRESAVPAVPAESLAGSRGADATGAASSRIAASSRVLQPTMTGLVGRPQVAPDAVAPVAATPATAGESRPRTVATRPNRVFRTESRRPEITRAQRTVSAGSKIARPLPAIARAVHRAASAQGSALRVGSADSARRVGLASSPVVRGASVDRRDVEITSSGVASALERRVTRSDTVAATDVRQATSDRAPAVPGRRQNVRAAVPMAVARPETRSANTEAGAGDSHDGARGALRAIVSDGPSRRGRALPTVRAASRALAQERSGARGRMLSPSTTAHLAVRSSVEALSPTVLVRDSATSSVVPRSAAPSGGPAQIGGDVAGRDTESGRSPARARSSLRRAVDRFDGDGALREGGDLRSRIPAASSSTPAVRSTRLGGLARAAVRAMPVERVGEAGRMLAPRAVAAQDVEASPARVLEAARFAHLTQVPASQLAGGLDDGGSNAQDARIGASSRSVRSRVDARDAGRRITPVTPTARTTAARRTSAWTVSEPGRSVPGAERSVAGSTQPERAASRSMRADTRPAFVLAQPVSPSDAEVRSAEGRSFGGVRDGLASRATDRASSGSSRSALPSVTPEHGRSAVRSSELRRAASGRAVSGRDGGRASARRVDAARGASELARTAALRTPDSDTATTFGHRTVSGLVERSVALRTAAGRTERSDAWLTPADALTRSAGRLTEVGATARSRAIAPDARVLRAPDAQVGDEGTLAHAVRRASLPDDAQTVFARPAPAVSMDAEVPGARPVGVSGASVAGRRRGRTPSLRAVGRTAARLAERSVVPHPVGDAANDRQVLRRATQPLVEGTLARPAVGVSDAAPSAGFAAGARGESVAGGVRGTPARPGSPGRSRMERALRAATVHAGARSTPTVLTLASPQRALDERQPEPRRFTARIEQDAEGRVVRSSLVDDATGLTFAVPMAAQMATTGQADGGFARPSSWAEERSSGGVARSRTRAASSESRIARDVRGRTVSAANAESIAARRDAPEAVFATRVREQRAGIGLDSALGALTDAPMGRGGSGAPSIERRPLLRRRTWQRRGMAAELGTLAPALADADYAPAPVLPNGSPSWVQRAVHGTSVDNPPSQFASGPGPAQGATTRGAGAPEARVAGRTEGAPRAEARPNRLMSALSRADTPQDLVQVIVQRGSEVSSLRNELPAEAIRIVERIATLGPDEVAVLRRGRVLQADQSRTLSRTGNSRNRKTASDPSMLSAGHDGMGPNRITKLADKLMNLIHLAENSRKRDAQDQVRMANVEPSAASAESGAKSPGMSVENYDMNIRALEVAVLNSMMEAKEDLNARNPEEPDGRSKWF